MSHVLKRVAVALAAAGTLSATMVLPGLPATAAVPQSDVPAAVRQAADVSASPRGALAGTGEATAATSAAPEESRTVVATATQPVFRIAGTDRILTAIAASQDLFGDADTELRAGAVVLARADGFADALAGVPLAVRKDAPLLLTRGGSLDSRVRSEIQRILPTGRTVYVLGSTSVMSGAIRTALVDLGYTVVRYAGADRFATAADIATRGLGSPSLSFVTTGRDFPDALAAGNAAAVLGGAVVLSNDATLPPPSRTYLAAQSIDAATVVVGGPAEGAVQSPDLTLVGSNRFATSGLVTDLVFDVRQDTGSPLSPYIGVALGTNYPDALSGGAHSALLGAPIVLTLGTRLPAEAATTLRDFRARATASGVTGLQAQVYGSSDVVDSAVAAAIRSILG